MGSFVLFLSHFTSFQVRDGSNKEFAYSFNPDCFFAVFTPDPLKSNFSKFAILQKKKYMLINDSIL